MEVFGFGEELILQNREGSIDGRDGEGGIDRGIRREYIKGNEGVKGKEGVIGKGGGNKIYEY